MKAEVGFFQELQPNGIVANSFIRGLEALFFVLLCIYVFLSFRSYHSNIDEFILLLKNKCITEQSFNVLILQTKPMDWDILLLFITATVAPKVIQKFAEMRTGVKDSTETITKTASSEQSIKKS
jgi:hypothetical protein